MAEDSKQSLHVDTDWKKQAQEEKRRLAEAARQQRQEPTAPMGVVAGPPADRRGGAAQPGERGIPPAGLETLIQSIVTQVLLYLGELGTRGGENLLNLDLAKHYLDTLGVLEAKTRGNLTPEEQKMFDLAGYEARMRFIAVASRYAELP
jgi:hypothetical protein